MPCPNLFTISSVFDTDHIKKLNSLQIQISHNVGRLTVLVITHWSHWTLFLETETSIIMTVLAVLIDLK